MLSVLATVIIESHIKSTRCFGIFVLLYASLYATSLPFIVSQLLVSIPSSGSGNSPNHSLSKYSVSVLWNSSGSDTILPLYWTACIGFLHWSLCVTEFITFFNLPCIRASSLLLIASFISCLACTLLDHVSFSFSFLASSLHTSLYSRAASVLHTLGGLPIVSSVFLRSLVSSICSSAMASHFAISCLALCSSSPFGHVFLPPSPLMCLLISVTIVRFALSTMYCGDHPSLYFDFFLSLLLLFRLVAFFALFITAVMYAVYLSSSVSSSSHFSLPIHLFIYSLYFSSSLILTFPFFILFSFVIPFLVLGSPHLSCVVGPLSPSSSRSTVTGT